MSSSNYDVIVVGLGGMGSAAAFHLAARGQRVLGVERFEPPHTNGSSHGGSRITRQSYFEDPAYVPLLLRAAELYDRLGRDAEREVWRLVGGLMIGPEESLTVAGSLRSARQWDLPHELFDAADLARRFPTMTPAPSDVALYEANAGYVLPEVTVDAHLQLAQRAGAELRFREPMLGWHADGRGEGVVVTTAHDTYRAGRLVLAPGAWAPELLADLGVELTVERQVQYWFAPQGGTAPFHPDRHPVYIWEGADGVQVYGFPALDGPDGGVKTAFFRRGVVCTPETIDRTVADAEVEAMRAELRPRLPAVPGRLLTAVACLYTNTVDQHFVIATHPEHRQVAVACGFSGHGFKFTPVVGEILADLATDGTTSHPIEIFDPGRERLREPAPPPS